MSAVARLRHAGRAGSSSVEQGEALGPGSKSYRAGLVVAFHCGETNRGKLVGKDTTCLALLIAGDPMPFAIEPDDEAMVSVRSSRRYGVRHDFSLLVWDQETEAAMAAAVSRKPIVSSTLVNLNGAGDRAWVPWSAALMSAFTDETGSGRWVGT